jgi:hypothetical protein
MDALLAILMPGVKENQGTDQEVGASDEPGSGLLMTFGPERRPHYAPRDATR